jgi:putative pyruvate formate lyase activating enzyme
MPADIPAYITALKSGVLEKNEQIARKRLKACSLCPRNCKVNRLQGDTGDCRTGARAWVSSYNSHFGEEAPLVGEHGSGTIFFTHCNLNCNFCQNFDISQEGQGQEISDAQLASIMLSLQKAGCHNINFVTPSHVVPQILSALRIAANDGLRLPLVFNTSAYDRVSTLKLMEGIVDIYMPDFKFWDPKVAKMACNAENYPQVARKALLEMHRQVGDLVLDSKGIAQRGMIIRHLVLPDGYAGSREIMHFIADKLSTDSYVNIMKQYRPCGNADQIKALSKHPSQHDFDTAFEAARKEGITRLDKPRRVFMLW